MSSMCGNEGKAGVNGIYSPPEISPLNPYSEATALVKSSQSKDKESYIFDSEFLINLNRL